MPSTTIDTITITRPDDWHLHVRDGTALNTVVPHTAAQFGRAIIMPNLKPPVTTAAQALAYRQRIQAAVPSGVQFEPLMTLYLTDNLPADEIARAKDAGVVAAKLYPAGATTNTACRPAAAARSGGWAGAARRQRRGASRRRGRAFGRTNALRCIPSTRRLSERGCDFVAACGARSRTRASARSAPRQRLVSLALDHPGRRALRRRARRGRRRRRSWR